MINKDKFEKLDDEKLQKATGGAYSCDNCFPSDYHCDINSSCEGCENYFEWVYNSLGPYYNPLNGENVWDCKLGKRPVHTMTNEPAMICDPWNY